MTAGPWEILARVAARLRVREAVEKIDASLPHGRRTTLYAGYTLVHRRRNSLVERVARNGQYERAELDAIVGALNASTARTLVDVGANIGLISLAVLAAVPDGRVFAFEPGPEQYRLLAETVERNGLGSRLELSPLALSDAAGEAAFAVHSSRHAAGDGLVDTGRAGRTRTVTVQTDTLDAWWERKGRPTVDVVKLDTEGSELLILRGAASLVVACRPTIFLEIHEENLRRYPYGPEEVRRAIADLDYELDALGRADFVARPR